MKDPIVCNAKAPAEKMYLAAISVNVMLWIYIFTQADFLHIFITSAILGLFIVVEIILIYRAFAARKSFDIIYNQDSLIINNRTIASDHIKTVFVRGYFTPVIGIRPKGNVLVPYKNCFRFENVNDIKTLTEWAEQRQIKVAHKNFQRWL
ncbi:hypothetical protein [Paenibacillus sp. FSL R7-0273]|uniref:hypothetical protein n=1 Tax=Paenibacillus sp. FSL R7-0273 TaxID=1536772 RepID=UPI0006944A49|nr:hypothetical protein [Paenibacillus sp. FSL R7-0273]OMF94442.1 hypothetical protein BK144_07880 [Paenibacillus sp. FSL R7-0273]